MVHIKVPQDRIGAIIGPNGSVKETIEQKSASKLEIDSDSGSVEITPGNDPVAGMRASETIRAIGRGFNPEKAMQLLDDDMLMLDVIDLSDMTSTSKELKRIKGRIIGKNGKTREIAESLINVHISVYGKTVSVIGKPEQIQAIRTAIDMLVGGANHGTVYSYLEKKRQDLIQEELEFQPSDIDIE
ncbi:KH domain-containing protein [Methanohalobium sp.]|uniref:KH domain-containing protein n=1 Tax=Methanohalobium sp. TaxID=2837493 RepID=UPI0025E01B3A|nr:KH domain-containing protein [Methanohalobium sp.]